MRDDELEGQLTMPDAARKGDLDTGHGSRPATAAIEGSGDVSANGRPVLRRGDALAGHGCAAPTRSMSEGSPTVFVNGRPFSRIGDGVNCGGKMATGSPDVALDILEKPVFAKSECVRVCMQKARKRGQAFVGKS
ncbi:PAAR domain-containing protein [uncultured Paracoccus sp.]|uniref:PAAR domain-containing protein n=1 Tax=uncultured Paracoccus sp. TaxID=189685 RepID=UPI002626D144|nr:PAAR domain-containing protein [uncultured Paracoccus sp.]